MQDCHPSVSPNDEERRRKHYAEEDKFHTWVENKKAMKIIWKYIRENHVENILIIGYQTDIKFWILDVYSLTSMILVKKKMYMRGSERERGRKGEK